jgi:hypothetical protein
MAGVVRCACGDMMSPPRPAHLDAPLLGLLFIIGGCAAWQSAPTETAAEKEQRHSRQRAELEEFVVWLHESLAEEECRLNPLGEDRRLMQYSGRISRVVESYCEVPDEFCTEAVERLDAEMAAIAADCRGEYELRSFACQPPTPYDPESRADYRRTHKSEIDAIVESGECGSACCKVCNIGKACGDTCIARDKMCHTPPGCACDE